MKKIKLHHLVVLLLVIIFSSCKSNVQEIFERAYFEGQRDALNGDIRIKMGKDSTFIWVESPWDDDRNPVYNPTYLDTRNGN